MRETTYRRELTLAGKANHWLLAVSHPPRTFVLLPSFLPSSNFFDPCSSLTSILISLQSSQSTFNFHIVHFHPQSSNFILILLQKKSSHPSLSSLILLFLLLLATVTKRPVKNRHKCATSLYTSYSRFLPQLHQPSRSCPTELEGCPTSPTVSPLLVVFCMSCKFRPRAVCSSRASFSTSSVSLIFSLSL